MLAAGQYGAVSFAAHPHRIDHSVGSLPIFMPLQRRRYPPDKAVFFTGLRAGFFVHVTGAYVLGDECQRPPSVIPAHPRASGTGMTEIHGVTTNADLPSEYRSAPPDRSYRASWMLAFRGLSIGVEGAWGFTPLCPAGHLPLKGGDRSAAGSRPSQPRRMKRW